MKLGHHKGIKVTEPDFWKKSWGSQMGYIWCFLSISLHPVITSFEISETFNDWMQRYGQKHQKCPKNGGFPPFVTPKIFFQKSGSVTFILLWCPNFMQKIEKLLNRLSRFLKTDHAPIDEWITDRQTHVITMSHIGLNPSQQIHMQIYLYQVFHTSELEVRWVGKIQPLRIMF